ncbi:MAG: M55 family metallopeptidase [bacterium]
MLKIYISVDFEGTNGVVYPHQVVNLGGESYYLAQKQQYEELTCIIESLIEANVDLITINDAHGSMENLHLSELSPKVQLITGKPKPVSMLAGLDKTYSCVFFADYHAKAGSLNAVLAHTFSTIFNTVKLNNNLIGEIELNAIYAGLLDVPVAFLTGDNITCSQAINAIGNIKTVCTKTAISTTAAICRPNEELFRDLKNSVLDTLQNPQNWSLYKETSPYILELEFVDRKLADIAELLPGIERLSSNSVIFRSGCYLEIYKLLQFFAATLSLSKIIGF